MKYLSEIIEERQTKIFENLGVFFAFGMKQYNEQKKDGVKYVNMGVGMICPENNVEALINQLHELHEQGRKEDIELHGKEAIILRELINYECFLVCDISECVEALSGYKCITESEILAVYRENFDKYCD